MTTEWGRFITEFYPHQWFGWRFTPTGTPYAPINNGKAMGRRAWTTNGTSFTNARYGYGTVAANGYLYAGGYNGTDLL